MATPIGVAEALNGLKQGEELTVRVKADGTYDIEVGKEASKAAAKTGFPRTPKKVLDTETGIEYQSESKCGLALYYLVKDKVNEKHKNFAYYALMKRFPGRFKVLEG